MLWTIAVILLVLWALGLVTSYTMGGFIHILLVIAIVVVLVLEDDWQRLLAMPADCAGVSFTGTVTSPKLIFPVHTAVGTATTSGRG